MTDDDRTTGVGAHRMRAPTVDVTPRGARTTRAYTINGERVEGVGAHLMRAPTVDVIPHRAGGRSALVARGRRAPTSMNHPIAALDELRRVALVELGDPAPLGRIALAGPEAEPGVDRRD